MNGARETIVKFWQLPNKLVLRFELCDGAPERKELRPYLTYEGQEKVLAKLDVVEYSHRKVVLALPDKLVKFGLFRYEVHLLQKNCRACDTVKIQFCGDCKVTHAEAACDEC